MTSAFISYSRKDQRVALSLQDALRAKGRTTWIDLRGIEPTDQWKQAIYQAIDEADAFLYLLSPDALTSAFCIEELNYALDNKKRVIPVVVRTVSAKDVVKPIADLQWIFCLEDDEFNQAVDEVLLALDIDHPHRHLGSHLLMRARRWVNNGQKRDLLLPRGELKEAERWLAESANKPQGATELHIRFLNASQQRANHFRWMTTSASLVIAIVFVTLGSISAWQAQVATQQRNIALDRFASLLAANVESSLQQSNNPEQGLLLALSANNVHDTLITRTSLYHALKHKPRLLKILTGHFDNYAIILRGSSVDPANRGISGLSFIPYTDRLLSAGEGDGTFREWNITTGKSRMLPLSHHRHPYGINHFAMSPDGRLIASSGVEGIWIWDVRTGEQLIQLAQGGGYQAIAFSPDSRLMTVRCLFLQYACDDKGATITFWNSTTWKPDFSFVYPRAITSATFNLQGNLMATAGCVQTGAIARNSCTQGSLQLWDTMTGQPAGDPLVGHKKEITSVAFSPDGTHIASGGGDGDIVLWDVATGKRIGQALKAHSDAVKQILFSPEGQTLASASRDTQVILWNVSTAKPYTYLRGHDALVTSLAFSSDGRKLASADETNRILLWTTESVTPTMRYFFVPESVPRSMAISPDQKMIALGGGDGKIQVLESATGKVIKRLVTEPDCESLSSFSRSYYPCYLNLITFSQDNNYLTVASNAGNIISWDTQMWQRQADPMWANVPCGSLLCSAGAIDGLTFSTDMSLVAVKGKGEIWIWDLRTRQLKYHLRGHNGQKVRTVAFSPDGKLLASGGDDRTLLLWNLKDGQQIGSPLRGHIDGITMLAFNPKSNQLASSSFDNTIRFWDLQSYKEIGRVSNESIASDGFIAFSPDGRYLAGVTANVKITIWDTQTYQMSIPTFEEPGYVFGTTFTPSGKYLATVSAFSSNPSSAYVTLHTYQVNDWRMQACKIVSRNLTMAEIKSYSLADLGSQQVCPSLSVHSSVVRDKISQAQDAVDRHDTTAASAAFTQATQWAVGSDDMNLNYFVCVDGSLNRFPREVFPACQHAIDLVPEDKMYVDSRGIARVLLGDYSGAIEDFQSFVDWVKRHDILQDWESTKLSERLNWIAKLRAKDSTFIPQMLATVRTEYKQESPECRSGHCPLA